MISLSIDDKKVTGNKGQSILEIARANGIEIPALCYDERVKPYGGCGICVVEIEGRSKLFRSCATEAEEGMKIYTDTPRIRKSRQMSLELLLSDHSGDCRPPCALACPAGVDCQGYIGLIANGYYDEAVQLIKERLPLPTCIGLICPHPCEDACRRNMVDEPLAIANLKAFAGYQNLYGDNPYIPELKPSSGYKVAIVGGGPAGLTAAYFLAIAGHEATIYEAMPEAGGMLRYGIPQYRLDKKILDDEINLIKKMGVNIITGVRINHDITLEYLQKNYNALFLGIGAWKSSGIGCKGEDAAGVIGGIDFLRKVALHEAISLGEKVIVVGGGNTAMDAARTAVRLGAKEVVIAYRRTRKEMPAQNSEIEEAEQEGVIFKFLVAPEEIISRDGKVSAIRLQKMQLGAPDSSGRRRPEPIPGEEEIMPADTIIAAIGQRVDNALFGDYALTKWKTFNVNDTYMTSEKGVFAGGDAVSGPGIAIEAIAQAREAAQAIDAYLQGKEYKAPSNFVISRDIKPSDLESVPRISRVPLQYVEPEIRKHNFDNVAAIMTAEEARTEAKRCLECGCLDYYDCKLIKYAREYEVKPERMAGEKHHEGEKDLHPFIMRNSDKCILCGLCVRVCEEVTGVTALGLVDRGFNTLIKPEFSRPLQETDCISCGQCVAVCPTGALTEHNTSLKDVPLRLEEVETICSACGAGCRQRVRKYGNMITRVEPVKGGLLCAQGKFAWEETSLRLKQPLIRTKGHLTPVSWKEAMDYWSSQIKRHGQSNTALMISPACTLEEMRTAAELASRGLKTETTGCFAYNCGLEHYQWLKQSSADDFDGTDMIMMVGSFEASQVVAMRARQAATRGVNLVCINSKKSIADDQAIITQKILPEDTFLHEVLAAVVKDKPGFEKLENQLKGYKIRSEAFAIACEYSQAHKAIMVIDGTELSKEAVQVLTNIAVVSGHINASFDSIIIVSGGNAAGLAATGFTADRDRVIKDIINRQIKAAVIIDEDPAGADIVSADELSKLEFLTVLSPFMTPTAAQADLVLPGAIHFEKSGTFLGFDGKERIVNQVKLPYAGKDNREILLAMLNALKIDEKNTCSKCKDIAGEVSEPVIYIPGETAIFNEEQPADFLLRVFKERLQRSKA